MPKNKNTKQHKLEATLGCLNKVERRRFHAFLTSSFVNRRADVMALFTYLEKNTLEPREKTWSAVYPGEPFNDQKFRLCLSYLQQLAEQFLAFLQWQDTPGSKEIHLLHSLRQRGLEGHVPEALRSAHNIMEQQPLRNSDYFKHRGAVLWEEARFESVRKPGDPAYLQRLSDNADLIWITQKLRYLCLHSAQQNVYRSEHRLRFREEVEVVVKHFLHEPSVAVWYYCLKMLEEPLAVHYFTRFKEPLLAENRWFDADENRDLHLFAINYCIRRINEGQTQFLHDIVAFYKDGLAKGYLIENGVLSRFTYHNMVAAGLQAGEYNWVETILYAHKNTLERTYRESSFSFNYARLEFARKRYDVVLPMLQSSNYHDPLLALAAKAMALKIYFETGEFELLGAHLSAMKNYLRRKTTLGYHRTYYLNLVRYTQQLMVHAGDKQALERLHERVRNEPALTERSWLLEQMELMHKKTRNPG